MQSQTSTASVEGDDGEGEKASLSVSVRPFFFFFFKSCPVHFSSYSFMWSQGDPNQPCGSTDSLRKNQISKLPCFL